MPDRLPPLNALRAFDAAARHMSFADAAAELNVTPAALSQQIRNLESHLGGEVFRRLNRRVELTDIGVMLAPGVAAGFEQLQGAWSACVRRVASQHLTVTAGPVFLSTFLAPRMEKFVTAHPEVELRLTAALRALSFVRDGIDLAVRFGPGLDEGYFSEVIYEDWATPMCTPALAERLKTPADIAGVTLINTDSGPTLRDFEKFDCWCEAVGVEVPQGRWPEFSAPDGALGLALGGGGLVMGRLSLAVPHLQAGRLVMPFRESIRRGLRYRIVCPKGFEQSKTAVMFRDWIKGEVAALAEWEVGRVFV